MNNLSHIPWPSSRNAINPAFIDDVVCKVSKATGADIHMIKEEIVAGIIEHYKNKDKPHA